MRVSLLSLLGTTALVVSGNAAWTAVTTPAPPSRPLGSPVIVSLASAGSAGAAGADLGPTRPPRAGSDSRPGGDSGGPASTSAAGDGQLPAVPETPGSSTPDVTNVGSRPTPSASASGRTRPPPAAIATAAPHRVPVTRVRTLPQDDEHDEHDDEDGEHDGDGEHDERDERNTSSSSTHDD